MNRHLDRFLNGVIPYRGRAQALSLLNKAEFRRANRAEASLFHAEASLVILSEPLAQWDVENFPHIFGPEKRIGFHLSASHATHLAAVIEAYHITATHTGPIRMKHKLRGRTYAEQEARHG